MSKEELQKDFPNNVLYNKKGAVILQSLIFLIVLRICNTDDFSDFIHLTGDVKGLFWSVDGAFGEPFVYALTEVGYLLLQAVALVGNGNCFASSVIEAQLDFLRRIKPRKTGETQTAVNIALVGLS